MDATAIAKELEPIVRRLAAAGWKERDAIREELLAAAKGLDAPYSSLERCLEELKRDLPLEARWEVDEVLQTLAPEPEEPEDEPEDEDDDPDRPLSAADLNLVYDDPRGLMLHQTKDGARWFATQRDPMTGQPQTVEVPPAQVDALKAQLRGSPYWLLGSGATPT